MFSQDVVTSVLLLISAFCICKIHYNCVPLVDPIDIVKDYIPPHEYLVEEDPKLYQSVKTKRGPLSDDWIEEINQNHGESPVMCAYKLCKVEFRYWGMQSKIERFIHDVGRYSVVCVLKSETQVTFKTICSLFSSSLPVSQVLLLTLKICNTFIKIGKILKKSGKTL